MTPGFYIVFFLLQLQINVADCLIYDMIYIYLFFAKNALIFSTEEYKWFMFMRKDFYVYFGVIHRGRKRIIEVFLFHFLNSKFLENISMKESNKYVKNNICLL